MEYTVAPPMDDEDSDEEDAYGYAEVFENFNFDEGFTFQGNMITSRDELFSRWDEIVSYYETQGVNRDMIEVYSDFFDVHSDKETSEIGLRTIKPYLDDKPADLRGIVRNDISVHNHAFDDDIQVADIVNAFGVEDLINPTEGDSYEKRVFEHSSPAIKVPTSAMPPPRLSHTSLKKMKYLVISAYTGARDVDYAPTALWSSLLSPHMQKHSLKFSDPPDRIYDHINDDLDICDDEPDLEGSRTSVGATSFKRLIGTRPSSNTRPPQGVVWLEDTKGNRLNIGSHNYNLSTDKKIPVDFSDVSRVYSELFSAPAGECLHNATPSHELHQMVSARLSSALERGGACANVMNEHDTHDIQFEYQPMCQTYGPLVVDVTTPTSLWTKLTRKVRMIVIDKYALGSAMARLDDNIHAPMMALCIANALAMEHPAHYGTIKGHVSLPDLNAQHRIVTKILSFSRKTISTLSQMSYDVVLSNCIEDANKYDVKSVGASYTDKAKVLIDTIPSMYEQERYAIPPLIVGNVCGMPAGAFSIEVLGNIFSVDDPATTGKNQERTSHVEDQALFRKHFPVCGLISTQESIEMADMLNSKFLTCRGRSHGGPVFESSNEDLALEPWDAATELYKRSGVCQYLEILRDVALSIYKTSAPSRGMWSTRSIYNNKAIMFYSLRDNINSPEGYRADWFCITPFPVVGSQTITDDRGVMWHLWPRQVMRSQSMDHHISQPHRIKLLASSMISKCVATRSSMADIIMAIQRVAMTAACGSWHSGKILKISRYLSGALSAPASPFSDLAKKFVPAKNLCDIMFYQRVHEALVKWDERGKYLHYCPLLGVTRAFSQVETYWEVWAPYNLANTSKHMLDCALGIFNESLDLERSLEVRLELLSQQEEVLSKAEITRDDIAECMSAIWESKKDTAFGWSCFGSMASAYALSLRSSVQGFDKRYSRGGKSTRIVDHLTVRHSAYIDKKGILKSGTVTSAVLQLGLDRYLSTITPTAMHLYGKCPIFFTHPKDGEHGDREISIADPVSRIALNKAESAVGAYGAGTGIDLLKVKDKDARFYATASSALTLGGCIRSSDASRYSPHMSNNAIAICVYTLGVLGGSSHLMSAGVTYWRLANKVITIPESSIAEAERRSLQTTDAVYKMYIHDYCQWVRSLPVIADDKGDIHHGYCAAAHMGQGMSHHGSSLMHSGSIAISMTAAASCRIMVSGKEVKIIATGSVTSDDSTIVTKCNPMSLNKRGRLTRGEMQRASQIYLGRQRLARASVLWSVSVTPNEAKERDSGTSGEFNSNDTGIGYLCPVLGFRELVCQLVPPTSSSLMGDLITAFYYGKAVALSGQDFTMARYAHRCYVDLVKTRWQITLDELDYLRSCRVVPRGLIDGCASFDFLNSPAHLLPPELRNGLIAISEAHNKSCEELNIYTRDTVFSPLLHISIPSRTLHRSAIQQVTEFEQRADNRGLRNQAEMLREVKRSLTSSARTRGLGRVAMRIRNKMVTASPYLDHELGKGELLHMTLNWFATLEKKCVEEKWVPEAYHMGQSCNQVLSFYDTGPIEYPQPPERRRTKPVNFRAPKLIVGPYGVTPMGRHAVERACATVVEKVTHKDRQMMSYANAMKSMHKITEHVVYGSKIIISWQANSAGNLRSFDLREEMSRHDDNTNLVGSFSDDAISSLKELESNNPSSYVLALHGYKDGAFLFHAITDSGPISFLHNAPFDDIPQLSTHTVVDNEGRTLILYNQGTDVGARFAPPGVTRQEVDDYVNNINGRDLPAFVEEQYQVSKVPKYASIATYSYLDKTETEDTLYTCMLPWSQHARNDLDPTFRAKHVCDMAIGGYWYIGLHGVALRAAMRGHSGVRCAWVGDVLGWRCRGGNIPNYGYDPPRASQYVSMTVCGAVLNESSLSSGTISPYSREHCVLTSGGAETVAKVVEIDYELKSSIYALNDSNRFHVDPNDNDVFVKIPFPAHRGEKTGFGRDYHLLMLRNFSSKSTAYMDI